MPESIEPSAVVERAMPQAVNKKLMCDVEILGSSVKFTGQQILVCTVRRDMKPRNLPFAALKCLWNGILLREIHVWNCLRFKCLVHLVLCLVASLCRSPGPFQSKCALAALCQTKHTSMETFQKEHGSLNMESQTNGNKVSSHRNSKCCAYVYNAILRV